MSPYGVTMPQWVLSVKRFEYCQFIVESDFETIIHQDILKQNISTLESVTMITVPAVGPRPPDTVMTKFMSMES